MHNLSEEKENLDAKKEDREEKKEKVAFFEKGGLYSGIPKNRKSLIAINIFVIITGLALVTILILGVVLR